MSYPHTEWRLLVTPPSSGSWNMAVDNAILDAVIDTRSSPTLRLYAWDPPCLSLGYAQPLMEVDIPRLENRGWDLVRRPTGGRAILHTDELTYAVIAPADEPRLAGGVVESYQRLSRALLHALIALGAPAKSEKGDPQALANPEKGPVCFEIPSHYEITVNGKKLIGSAQVRRRGGILQHGSLPLGGDLTRINQVLQYEHHEQRQQASRQLLDHATTLETIFGQLIPWETAAEAIRMAFQEQLNLTLLQSDLTDDERTIADHLENEIYNNPEWMERV